MWRGAWSVVGSDNGKFVGLSDAMIFFLDILSDKATNVIKAFRFEAMN
jgi:hypothetical protein